MRRRRVSEAGLVRPLVLAFDGLSILLRSQPVFIFAYIDVLCPRMPGGQLSVRCCVSQMPEPSQSYFLGQTAEIRNNHNALLLICLT